MFPQFQRVVTLSVMSILVGLFTWIYVRDRQPRARLWMIGWACIVAHFAGMLLFFIPAWLGVRFGARFATVEAVRVVFGQIFQHFSAYGYAPKVRLRDVVKDDK